MMAYRGIERGNRGMKGNRNVQDLVQGSMKFVNFYFSVAEAVVADSGILATIYPMGQKGNRNENVVIGDWGKKARALRGPVGVDERECKRSEQNYDVVKNARREKGQREQDGVRDEKEGNTRSSLS